MTGILGTKEYRKPEWVTHMEELQLQLRGKERTLSLDSLEHEVVRQPCAWSEEIPEAEFVEQNCGGSFYLLPPIEEFSEPSGSGSIGERLSTSCQELYASTELCPSMRSRCQTFPRSRVDAPAEPRPLARYATEPRELDPEGFHQLHTADSSEELQEFLLLESQCMTTDTGLAHAFLQGRPTATNPPTNLLGIKCSS